MPTLRFARVQNTTVLVVGVRRPAALDWTAYVQFLAQCVAVHGVRSLLVVTFGGAPSPRQQKEVTSTVYQRAGRGSEVLRTAVCGDGTLVRLATRAIGWLSGAQLRSFRVEERDPALDYLCVAEPARPAVLDAVRRFEAELTAGQ